MTEVDPEEKPFEDDLREAFEIAGRADDARCTENAFQRVGRFQLHNLGLGNLAAVAEIKYFPNGKEAVGPFKDYSSMTLRWELDQFRLLINEMPEGEERTYLETIEAALTEYSWLQWAVEDTGANMRPAADLSLIARRTKDMMEKLQPIRNPDALIPERAFARGLSL